jgi:hypothetical protein
MYWWPDLISPLSFLKSMYYSEEEPLFNLGYYKNPEFDKLVDEGDVLTGTDREAATGNLSKRKKSWWMMRFPSFSMTRPTPRGQRQRGWLCGQSCLPARRVLYDLTRK